MTHPSSRGNPGIYWHGGTERDTFTSATSANTSISLARFLHVLFFFNHGVTLRVNHGYPGAVPSHPRPQVGAPVPLTGVVQFSARTHEYCAPDLEDGRRSGEAGSPRRRLRQTQERGTSKHPTVFYARILAFLGTEVSREPLRAKQRARNPPRRLCDCLRAFAS